jgi:hypothetical protein
MRLLFRLFILVVLLSVELYAVYAVLHPHVSPDYRAYFIDRTADDWKPPHYPATPQQGITFAQEGWPDFVHNSWGFSLREPSGRWTDATLSPTPTIFLNRQFSGPLCIEMVMLPSPAERGHKLLFSLGSNLSDFELSNPDFATYRVSFENAQPADTVQFRFDGQVPPNNKVAHAGPDPRRLGIRISALRIFPSTCSQIETSATP